MEFLLPEVSYNYSIVKWKLLHSSNQLQCFCGQPIKRPQLTADICSCDQCGLSLSIKAVQALVAAKAFKKWPLMQVPVCKDCKVTGLRCYGNFQKSLTFACKCAKPKYFKCTDGNSACWDEYIDVEKASNLIVSNAAVETKAPTPIRAIPTDMF